MQGFGEKKVFNYRKQFTRKADSLKYASLLYTGIMVK